MVRPGFLILFFTSLFAVFIIYYGLLFVGESMIDTARMAET
ncbi:hypothetical protein PNC201_02485 [Pseudoalteromonas sp. NC201]|nr:hypothetical protein PNC201_02485 [Pseudoalteromonas sp. NC201]